MGWVSDARRLMQKEYGGYVSWCKQNDIKPISYTEFKIIEHNKLNNHE